MVLDVVGKGSTVVVVAGTEVVELGGSVEELVGGSLVLGGTVVDCSDGS